MHPFINAISRRLARSRVYPHSTETAYRIPIRLLSQGNRFDSMHVHLHISEHYVKFTTFVDPWIKPANLFDLFLSSVQSLGGIEAKKKVRKKYMKRYSRGCSRRLMELKVLRNVAFAQRDFDMYNRLQKSLYILRKLCYHNNKSFMWNTFERMKSLYFNIFLLNICYEIESLNYMYKLLCSKFSLKKEFYWLNDKNFLVK